MAEHIRRQSVLSRKKCDLASCVFGFTAGCRWCVATRSDALSPRNRVRGIRQRWKPGCRNAVEVLAFVQVFFRSRWSKKEAPEDWHRGYRPRTYWSRAQSWRRVRTVNKKVFA